MMQKLERSFGPFHILLLFIAFSSTLRAESIRSYSVILNSNTAGKQVTTVQEDNSLKIDFEYSDRGRGPKLAIHYVLDDDGIPISTEISGNDYLKSPVEEHFSRKGSTVSWKNEGEEGTREINEKAFYISVNSAPEEMGILARALWRSPEKHLNLLPEGEATIEKIEERVVKKDKTERKLTHYSITGLDFLPVSVWLDEDQTFFASVSSWFSTIPEGWEEVFPELLEAQSEFLDRRIESIAQTLIKKPEHPVVFQGVNLFDSENAVMLSGQSVIISGNRILSVKPEDEITIPENAEVIDGTGKTLIPGLSDMHVHLGTVDGILNLAAGVTTVRDLANDIDTVTAFQKKFATGEAIGPRVILAGVIDSRGPYAAPSKVLADTEQEAKEAIDRYASLGYEQIKIYSSLKPELVPFIIQYAHSKGLRISGHIPAFMTAREVVEMGLDEIQHANFLFLNFLAEVKDTRTPLRFTAVAQQAANLDLSSPAVNDFLKLLLDRKVDLDPTLNVFESLFTDRPGTMSAGIAAIADRLPAQNRRSGLTGGLPVPEGMDQVFRNSFQAMKQMIKKAFDLGIPVVAGTDSLPGFGLHRELELYVDAGIPAVNALQTATIIPARIMKREKDFGSITPGKMADLILVEGNPAVNISDIRNVQIVCKDGILFHSSDLYREVGIKP